jgi:hypothetical protein
VQLIVAGITADNRSGVIRRQPLSEQESVSLWSTTENPPRIERPRTGTRLDANCLPGNTAWGLNYTPPNTVRDIHRTDLLSYNIILSGRVDLILEDERVQLGVGDCLVCLGVLHGWQTGNEGVLFAYTAIGLEPA